MIMYYNYSAMEARSFTVLMMMIIIKIIPLFRS